MHTTEQIIQIAGAPDYIVNKRQLSSMSGSMKITYHQVNKCDIDSFFTKNHSSLLLAIKKTKIKYKQATEWECEELLSATYLHLIDNMDKMKEEKHIESFFMRYMSNQIKWSNSKINQMYEDNRQIPFNYEFDVIDDESDFNHKIILEKDYNNKKAILFDFYSQLPTKQEKILFEVIFKKGIKTVKALSLHFGINKNYVQNMKKKLFDDLKVYINNIDEKQYK